MKIDDIIAETLAEHRLVGLVMMVAQHGSVIFQRAAGWADREQQHPMTLETQFRLSSVTKPFVTLSIGKLLEQERLSLSDPVTRWLPYFTPKLPQKTTPIITLEHLLFHTSGLDYGFSQPENGVYRALGIEDGLASSPLTLSENLHRLAQAPLGFMPGSAVRYSLATDVLGAVIEQVCQLSLPEAVHQLISIPLGLQSATFSVPRAQSDVLSHVYVNDEPQPHLMIQDERVTNMIFSPERIFDETAYPSGGAGMASNCLDVLRVLDVLRAGGQPLFREETLSTLLADHAGKTGFAPGWGFGASWMVLRDPARAKTQQAVGTLMWGGVYGHNWFVDRQNGLVVVILTNTLPEGLSGAFVDRLTQAIYRELL